MSETPKTDLEVRVAVPPLPVITLLIFGVPGPDIFNIIAPEPAVILL